MSETLEGRIKRHEHLSLEPYRDSLGFWTIGYGHRIDPSITLDKADSFFVADLATAIRNTNALRLTILSTVRHGVIVEMCFQLGEQGVKGFHNMFSALGRSDWAAAADAMLDSTWARQTPARANELADIMRTGKDTEHDA